MYALGINAVYHDSSAALLKDGRLIAAAEEERFTRIKHAKRPIPHSTYELPHHAVSYCLGQAGISLADVERVAYSYDPSLYEPDFGWGPELDPLFLDGIRQAPRLLTDAAPHHLRDRFRGAEAGRTFEWTYQDHHAAHAASAFFVSPFDAAAVLTLDGRGESATASYSTGESLGLTRLADVRMPNSLGLFYEEITEHLGFLRASDEYKVMAMASSGKPAYVDALRQRVQWHGDGHFTTRLGGWADLLGPARRRGEPLESRHWNIAHSLQKVLEETVLEMVRWLYEKAPGPNLCLAGGVALNCVMNARLRDEGPFRHLWVQPAAGDAGTSLGAALLASAPNPDHSRRSPPMEHAYWGPAYGEADIEAFLRWARVPYQRIRQWDDVAALLEQGRILGWFQGRMEFGPRALGARSVIASPISPDMQARLNELKDREDFRPVAPVVLEERAADWFERGHTSPFMLFVFQVRPEKASRIPAVTHADGSARVQTVNRHQNPAYYDLLHAFERRTGVPVLVNTSFNTRGEPIVCSPRDALECFWSSPLDALVMGSFLIEKRA